jgi:hypothetical protein
MINAISAATANSHVHPAVLSRASAERSPQPRSASQNEIVAAQCLGYALFW